MSLTHKVAVYNQHQTPNLTFFKALEAEHAREQVLEEARAALLVAGSCKFSLSAAHIGTLSSDMFISSP